MNKIKDIATLRRPKATLPKSFKWLVYANIILIVCTVFVGFGFPFFAFGGYPPFAVLGGFCLLILMLLFIGLVLIFIIDLIFSILLWKKIRFRVLFLFGILIAGYSVFILADNLGRKLANSRFDKNITRYEKVVAMIKDGSLEITENQPLLPSGYGDLASFVYIKKGSDNDPNNIVIEFMVGSAGFVGHTSYLYSSSGIIEENSKMAIRWKRRKQVKNNWFRAYGAK